MSQVMATPTTVTVVSTGAATATMGVTTAFTSIELVGVLDQNNVVLPPALILMDTVRGVAGFSVLLQ